MTQVPSTPTFKREALPQDIEPYRGEAMQRDRGSFELMLPYPFLLYVRSKLWDKSLVLSREQGGGETRVVQYEFFEGGYSFLHPIRKRQTNPKDPGIVLGRSTNMDLIVPVPSVSKTHAIFYPPKSEPGQWSIVDTGSSNGTWVGEDQLAPRQPRVLRDGDYLRLGGNLIAWFVLPGRLWHLLRHPDEMKKLIDV